MPRGDGTGPMAMGPRTGRAAGYCAGYAVPGFMNPTLGRGLGMAWGRGGRVGTYRIHYAKTLEVVVDAPIIGGKNISEWHRPNPSGAVPLAWTGRNGVADIGVYLFEWENPRPELAIERIDFVSADKGPVLGLIAVTALR